VELSIASRVSNSSEALKPSQLDNELIEDWQNRLWGLPPCVYHDVTHMVNAPPYPFSPLFVFHVLLLRLWDTDNIIRAIKY